MAECKSYEIYSDEDAKCALESISNTNAAISLKAVFLTIASFKYGIDNFIQLIDNAGNIERLQLFYFMLLNEKEVRLIMEAIARNKTIKKLMFHFYDDGTDKSKWYEQFGKSIVKFIRHHPCIEYLEFISPCEVRIIDDIVKNKSRKLKHLAVNAITNESLEILLKDDSMQTIILKEDILKFNIPTHWLTNNTSLLQFDYHNPIFAQYGTNVWRKKLYNAIDKMLGRNGQARQRAKMAALYLIAIRKFRYKQSGSFGWIPKDMTTIIAKHIYNSYTDDAWRTTPIDL